MMVRAFPIALLFSTGCMIMAAHTPDVPSTARPTLPDDQPIQLESDVVQETRNYKVTTGETCFKGTSDCVVSRENRSKRVNVSVAEASVDDAPISIGKVAVAASPEYVKDTDTLRGAVSACKRGKIIVAAGWIAATGAYLLLNRAYGVDPVNRSEQIGGFAALGAAVVGVGGGYFLFGGQRCGEIKEIYRRWKPVYTAADDSKVRGESAEMLEKLVEKFNRDHARAASTPMPAPEADVTTD